MCSHMLAWLFIWMSVSNFILIWIHVDKIGPCASQVSLVCWCSWAEFIAVLVSYGRQSTHVSFGKLIVSTVSIDINQRWLFLVIFSGCWRWHFLVIHWWESWFSLLNIWGFLNIFNRFSRILIWIVLKPVFFFNNAFQIIWFSEISHLNQIVVSVSDFASQNIILVLTPLRSSWCSLSTFFLHLGLCSLEILVFWISISLCWIISVLEISQEDFIFVWSMHITRIMIAEFLAFIHIFFSLHPLHVFDFLNLLFALLFSQFVLFSFLIQTLKSLNFWKNASNIIKIPFSHIILRLMTYK